MKIGCRRDEHVLDRDTAGFGGGFFRRIELFAVNHATVDDGHGDSGFTALQDNAADVERIVNLLQRGWEKLAPRHQRKFSRCDVDYRGARLKLGVKEGRRCRQCEAEGDEESGEASHDDLVAGRSTVRQWWGRDGIA